MLYYTVKYHLYHAVLRLRSHAVRQRRSAREATDVYISILTDAQTTWREAKPQTGLHDPWIYSTRHRSRVMHHPRYHEYSYNLVCDILFQEDELSKEGSLYRTNTGSQLPDRTSNHRHIEGGHGGVLLEWGGGSDAFKFSKHTPDHPPRF
jgi:hypothetical protein